MGFKLTEEGSILIYVIVGVVTRELRSYYDLKKAHSSGSSVSLLLVVCSTDKPNIYFRIAQRDDTSWTNMVFKHDSQNGLDISICNSRCCIGLRPI